MACFEDAWAGGWPLLSPDVYICNIVPPPLLEGWTPTASSTMALLYLSVYPNLKASNWLPTVDRQRRGGDSDHRQDLCRLECIMVADPAL